VNDRQVDVLGVQEIIRSERTREKSRSSDTRAELRPASAEFAVLFWMAEKWRAIQNKTTNSYVIEIET
jgi:hypothetical protein